MISVTDQQLQDFEDMLPWYRPSLLPDGRVLGQSCIQRSINKGKSQATAEIGNEARLTKLIQSTDLSHKRVLEVGCLEGNNTVDIAPLCRELVAVEIRPRNVINLLARLFVHNIENVHVVMKDVRELGDSEGEFDTIFHAGLLYHLPEPVQHLFDMVSLAPELLLDTGVCYDETDFPRNDILYRGKTYRAHLHTENGWADPLSGVDMYAKWLTLDSLCQVLKDAGYDQIEISSIVDVRAGRRVALRASRPVHVQQPSSQSGNQANSGNTFARAAALAAETALSLRMQLERVEHESSANKLEIARLQDELSAARKEIQALRDSTTWKAGRMLVLPVAKIRDIVS